MLCLLIKLKLWGCTSFLTHSEEKNSMGFMHNFILLFFATCVSIHSFFFNLAYTFRDHEVTRICPGYCWAKGGGGGYTFRPTGCTLDRSQSVQGHTITHTHMKSSIQLFNWFTFRLAELKSCSQKKKKLTYFCFHTLFLSLSYLNLESLLSLQI